MEPDRSLGHFFKFEVDKLVIAWPVGSASRSRPAGKLRDPAEGFKSTKENGVTVSVLRRGKLMY